VVPYDDHVVGFSGERVGTKGYIELYTTFGQEKNNTSYNILLGRPSINRLMTIVSTPHLTMKFHSKTGDIRSTWTRRRHESAMPKAFRWSL